MRTTFERLGSFTLAAAIGWVGMGCTGEIAAGTQYDDGAGRRPVPRADPPGGPRGGGPVPSGEGEGPRGFAPAPARIVRLTNAELRATLRDLVGTVPTTASALEPDQPLAGFRSVGAGESTISPRGVEAYDELARAAAQALLGDPDRRSAAVGCAPAGTKDACVRGFLERFGGRAWRRPMTAAELDRYEGLVANVAALPGADLWGGLESAVAAMLASPHFLYRTELGEEVAGRPGARRLTGPELAARLSYVLTGTLPDPALAAAAARGKLGTSAELRAEMTRLLATPPARAALLGFFVEHLELERLEDLEKDPKRFPQWTRSLARSMREELERLVSRVVFDENGDVRTLLDRDRTFVDGELAAIYGLPVTGAEMKEVKLPADGQRVGLLGTAGILASHASRTETSPTLRGLFILHKLLCRTIPPPPPDVMTELPKEQAADGSPRTMRQRVELHRDNPACVVCHQSIDPLGLALENFDSLGRFRTMEANQPIDPSGALDGHRFTGARALATMLRGSADVTSCFVSSAHRFASGDAEEQPAAVEAVAARWGAGGHRFLDLVTEILVGDGFRLVAPARKEP